MRVRFATLLLALVLLTPVAPGRAQTPAKPALPPDKLILALHVDMADGKLVSLWNALPGSYQKDLQSLVSDTAGKVDPEVFAKGVAVFRKAVQLLKDKKEFVLKNDALAQLPLTDPKKLPQFYDAVLAVLATLADSELTRLDDLKKADVGKVLSGTGVKVFKQIAAAEEFVDESKFNGAFQLPVHNMIGANERLKKDVLTVVKSDDKEATVNWKVTTGFQRERQIVFTNVEGKWIDKKLVEEWPMIIKGSQTGLEFVLPFVSKDGKPAALDFLGKIDKSLDALAAAKTADDFNKEARTRFPQFFPGAK
jgi:hypothetical protein